MIGVEEQMPQPKTDILRLPPIGSECFILDPPGFSFVVDSLHFARNVGAYVEGLMKDGISARYALADEGTIWTRTKPDSHPRCIATTAQLIEDNKTLSDRIASAASELGALADRLMGCRIPDRDGIIRCQIHRCRDFLTNISTRIITEQHDGQSTQ
jgi:hypothetical protein